MLRIELVVVGKIKEEYLRRGCDEYIKRLGGMCKLGITEIKECRLPESPSPAQILQGLEAEGADILAQIPRGSFAAVMCIEGTQQTSPQLAKTLERVALGGDSTVVFVIGGSHGLSCKVKERGNLRLSMSEMTFPHQLARLMLLEQIYRALSINTGSKYHK